MDAFMYGVLFLTSDAPSAPTDLAYTSITYSNVSLSWKAPSYDGERSDVFYVVRYKTQGNDFETYTPPSKITNHSVTVTGLSPVTTYTIVVIAENAVTEEFSNEFADVTSRTSNEITITTTPSRELHTNTAHTVHIYVHV